MSSPFYFWVALTLAIFPLASAGVSRLIPVADGWARNSVNANILRRDPITTFQDTQYIAFYDAKGNLVLGKRRLGTSDWTLQATPYSGNVCDAHNGISIMTDGAGILHVSWDHHGHPLRYARSVAPGSLELTGRMPMAGLKENKVTYPEFYKLPDGNLVFLYRDGASGRGDLMMNHYDVRSATWTQRQDAFINGEGQRNPYWQMCIDGRGTLHLSWVWRETGGVQTNHDMGYARSRDGGFTWEKSTGEPYALPITAATTEYAARIPQNHELINTTSITADSLSRPYIATYFRPPGTTIPQYHLIHHDGAAWHTTVVSRRTTPFTLSGGGTKRIPISRCQILTRDSVGTTRGYLLFRDIERGSRVSMAQTDDLASGTWTVEDLTDFPVDMWEPAYDTTLWREKQQLHLFVQRVSQGDGETLEGLPPQPIFVLEWEP